MLDAGLKESYVRNQIGWQKHSNTLYRYDRVDRRADDLFELLKNNNQLDFVTK